MWHFNVHVTLHSATRIIVRTALIKLFALQQLLLPRDYWIFDCSSKPYFTACSSRAAARTHWRLWYWASNRMHWEAIQLVVIPRHFAIGIPHFSSYLRGWALVKGHLDLDLALTFSDLYWWDFHFKMGGKDSHVLLISAGKAACASDGNKENTVAWINLMFASSCLISSSFKAMLLEVLPA